MKKTLLAIFVFTMLLISCKNNKKHKYVPEFKTEVEKAENIRKADNLIGEIVNGSKKVLFHGSGTEPFWDIYITENEILIIGIEWRRYYTLNNKFNSSLFTQKVLYSDSRDKEYTINIVKKPSGDGMSNREFPYSCVDGSGNDGAGTTNFDLEHFSRFYDNSTEVKKNTKMNINDPDQIVMSYYKWESQGGHCNVNFKTSEPSIDDCIHELRNTGWLSEDYLKDIKEIYLEWEPKIKNDPYEEQWLGENLSISFSNDALASLVVQDPIIKGNTALVLVKQCYRERNYTENPSIDTYIVKECDCVEYGKDILVKLIKHNNKWLIDSINL